MAFKKSAPKTAQNTTTRKEPVRQAITLEAVVARAPHSGLAENLSRTFGLDCPEYAAIREGTEENVVRSANVLRDDLNDKAMEIHLQRIVGSFVSSAYGASTFYQTKVTTAKDLTMASQNDSRDEDRDGVATPSMAPGQRSGFAGCPAGDRQPAALGAIVLPDEASAREQSVAALDALSILCDSATPTKPDDAPKHHHRQNPDCAICPLGVALAMPAAVLVSGPTLAPPSSHMADRSAFPPPARGPPAQPRHTPPSRGLPS